MKREMASCQGENKDRILDAIAGIQSDNDRIREEHFNYLLPLSEKNPGLLYEHWDLFVSMLGKPEVSNKYYAIHLIANVIREDKEDKFRDLFREFYGLLNHESPVVSPHIAGKSGKIIRARPEYEARIVDLLLNIQRTSRCRHLELQKAYVIEALDEAYDLISDKDRVMEFVGSLLKSESAKTRKAAKTFLIKRKEPIPTGTIEPEGSR
jgi:hypothetical protein